MLKKTRYLSFDLFNDFDYYRLALVIAIAMLAVFLYLFLLEKRKHRGRVLICPIRGTLKKEKYDIDGNYSEEYRTIQLVKLFLKKGYRKEQIIFEYVIRIGSGGRNSLRADLVIKKDNKFFLVAEIKNNSREFSSAVKYQLLPTMSILNAKYGIYFDGSKKSCLYIRKKDGLLIRRPFP